MTPPDDDRPGFIEEREDDNVVNLDKERQRRNEMAVEAERLARLPELDYIAAKKDAAKRLKVRIADLEKLVNAKRVKPPKDGFEMRKSGLYKRENGELRLVSQPFEVVMKVRDLSFGSEAGGWGIKIKFADEYGVEREASASIGHLHQDANAAVGLLAECGLRVEGTKMARLDLAQFLIAAKSKNKSSIVRRTGWIDAAGTAAFVMPDRIIGLETDEHLIWPPEAGPNPYGQSGTLDEWRREVATPAAHHRVLRFEISLSFAPPLLKLARGESGGFHKWGASSKGKSVSQSVGASVWGSGNPDGPYIQTWNQTLNAVEDVLVRYCDTALPLDEISQADKSALAKVPYTVAGGAGKGRLNRTSEAIATRHWRTLFSSSGEASFEALIAMEQRGEALAGQTVRVIDIRIAEDEGLGVFELSPDFNPAKFAEQMERASSTWFGTAGPEFVRQLIERKIAAERVIGEIDAFTNEALGDGNGGQVGRAAKRFALVATAGELAIEFGVLPWAKGDAKAAALDLFKFWIAERGGTDPAEKRSDLARIRRVLEADGDARFEDAWALPRADAFGNTIKPPPVRDRLGFRRGEGNDRLWYFLPTQFQKISAPRSATDVARHLDEIGALERSDTPNDRHLTRRVRIPGVGNLRLYVITTAIMEGSDGDDED
jgi:putative DNA primase/helicase